MSRVEATIPKVRAPGAKAWALRQLKLAVESMIRMSPDGRRAFLDPRVFPWTDRVERGWQEIRRELDAVMTDDLIPFEQQITPESDLAKELDRIEKEIAQ